MLINIESLKQKLQMCLTPKRYLHSLGTAAEAQSLAHYWKLDEDKAYLAGLLHDNAKGKLPEKLLTLAINHGLKIDDWGFNHPGILHGPVAAVMLGEEWGIEDKEIAEAISSHTIPTESMSNLAKVIYLADKIEPNRPSRNDLRCLRKLAYLDLDIAMRAALGNCLAYMRSKGEEPHPSTKEIWEGYRKNKKVNKY